MSAIVIKKIDRDISRDLFDCGNASINTLVRQSYFPTILQHAYCYMVMCDGEVVGYYMIRYKNIELDTCPEEIADYRAAFLEDCVSIHIEYLAVGKQYQKKGIGTFMLKYIISSVRELCKKWPVRLITIDAIKEKYDWYKDIGFEEFDQNDMHDQQSTIKMFIDCLIDSEVVDNYINQEI